MYATAKELRNIIQNSIDTGARAVYMDGKWISKVVIEGREVIFYCTGQYNVPPTVILGILTGLQLDDNLRIAIVS